MTNDRKLNEKSSSSKLLVLKPKIRISLDIIADPDPSFYHRDYSRVSDYRLGISRYIGCVGGMQVWEEGGAYSVHVTVLPAKNFIGGTLSLCVFMPWMLLPVDGCLRVCVRIPRNAYFTWRTTEIRVDAEMRNIDAKCSHFSQSFFSRVSRYYEHPLSCLRAPQLHRICYSTDDEINILYPVYYISRGKKFFLDPLFID